MNHFLAIVLHAHLPFVRHPEQASFHEENWFFEALAECYLPLLDRMQRWTDDALPWRLTLTLSPTLCAMLRDKLLADRFESYLQRRIELAALERQRHLLQPEFSRLAGFYEDFYRATDSHWRQLEQDPLAAFARHQAAGHLEVLTCAATHAYLPLLADHGPSVRAQLLAARDQHRDHFGTAPQGIWLPECGYTPSLDPHLKSANFSHFVLESHGVLHASPVPRRSSFAPILTRTGAAAFARDPSSARQVWSRTGGYPGDPRYREFHRDLVHDADREYLRSALLDPDSGTFTGFKYHRITSHSPGVDKLPYSPLDVVAWHGNLAPYKYDLARFNTIGTVSFDHPDPSIFTVLTSPSDTPGTANCDFVIFPPRWMVAERTFRPPWFHRNVMSEFMGLVHGAYDAKVGGFVPGGSSLHNCMSGHGPDHASYERAVAAELTPHKLEETLAFMFETRWVVTPTAFASHSPTLETDYDACWSGFTKAKLP